MSYQMECDKYHWVYDKLYGTGPLSHKMARLFARQNPDDADVQDFCDAILNPRSADKPT